MGEFIIPRGQQAVQGFPVNRYYTKSEADAKFATLAAGGVTSVTGITDRITSTGGTTPVIDIAATYVGQSSITTLGTIATGTWNATLIAGTYGGTGVNNGAKTFTYLKNISFTAADDTGVYTLPTGTKTLLATDGSGASLTNIPTTALTGALQAAQEPAHTGDVTNSAGSLALTIANSAVTQAKTANYSANTIWGNRTGGGAAAANVAYFEPRSQTYTGTITWNGTPPTTLTGNTYNWSQIGNMVTLTINVAYTNAGTTNTSCSFTLPTDCPTPLAPTGFTGNNAKLYAGYGYLDTTVIGNPSAGRCILGNDATSSGFVIVVVAASISAKCAMATVTYFTS